MKKTVNLIRRKAGTSLAEVLVALLISSILMGIAFGMMSTFTRFAATIKTNAHMDAMCDTANEYMRSLLQSATAISVKKIGINDADIVNQAAAYSTAADSVSKAILIRKNTEGKLRIYDMGKVNLSTFSSAISGPISDNDYGLFREAFYEGTSFNVSVTSSGGVVSITSQCLIYDTGTETVKNQPRTLQFNINGSIASDIIDGDDLSNGIAVLYQVNDYDIILDPTATPGSLTVPTFPSVTHTPSPSPDPGGDETGGTEASGATSATAAAPATTAAAPVTTAPAPASEPEPTPAPAA